MSSDKPWSREWTILDADGSGRKLFAEGSQFKLEPQPAGGEPLFYRLRAGKLIDKCFDGMPFYPMGVRDLKVGKLPKWDPKDANVRNKYLAAAEDAKQKGRDDPLARRLEGTFTFDGASAVARIYYFTGVRPEDRRDWIIFDAVTPGGSGARSLSAAAAGGGGDGTAHGDG
jgi:hypothetical protein